MAIDLKTRKTSKGRKHLVSKNPYLKLLVKLYEFLARRTRLSFHKIIAKRLIAPIRCRAPMSLYRLHRHMEKKTDEIAVVVGTITDDPRLFQCRKMKVCALRFTETARKRITDAGGECMTFDQLALKHPDGKRCVLLMGRTKARKAERHFGKAPGDPKSHTRPYVRSKGRKFEKARGRRKSRGYKK